MGIHQFVGGWLKRSYKKAFGNTKHLPSTIDSLFIDCNGIFHNAAQKVYLYGKYNDDNRELKLSKKTSEELFNAHVTAIIEEINSIYDRFEPRENFVIAPDGIANFGKMNQQRQRRYKNAGKSFFDSNAITPGTKLMNAIDQHIQEWIKMKPFKTKTVLYSSHLMTGEGEHKIYDLIRTNKIKRTNNAHLIYGLDSDLIILSCLSPLRNIYLIREETGEILNVNTLKNMLYQSMTWGKGLDQRRVLQDFSVLCMFIGNDFLPKFPSMINVSQMMTMSFSVYKQTKLYLTDENNTIIWPHLCTFLDRFTKSEVKYYLKNFTEPKSHPYPEYEKSKNHGEFNFSHFSRLWYKKHANSKQTMIKEYLKTLQWVQYYYNYGFNQVSNTHYYKYFYTPLPHDMLEFLKNPANHKSLTKFPKNCSISFVHQHLIVLPPASISLIDSQYHEFYRGLNNPDTFTTKLEGVHCFRCKCKCSCLDYMSIAYIPPIQKTKIMKLKCKLPEETLIEKRMINSFNNDHA